MRIGMGLLAFFCVVLGVLPMVMVPLLDRVIAPLAGISIGGKVLAMDGWALAPVNVEFSSLSTPVLTLLLAALAMLGLGLAVALGGRLKARHYKTWGCGINLTPRMEYTATGFVQPIKRVFSTIYQPTVKLETEFLHESRYFVKRRRFEFYTEPIFEKYLYNPLVTFFTTTADRLKVIQAGNLHLYLTYVFVTLILLLLLAV
jgi:hydrogenase-4 component B